MRFRIGEFSRITSLSVKSLRLYHERGILVPAEVDPATGYRYYGEGDVERARAIQTLKRFDFSLAEIGELLESCDDESQMLEQLEAKLSQVRRKIDRYEEISRLIGSILDAEKERAMNAEGFDVEVKQVETLLVAGHRMRGSYGDVGKALGKVCRKMGRHANGKPMTLYYDTEYKESDADCEPCVPVRKGQDGDGIAVHSLEGGRCASLIHKGPYESLRESYRKLFGYVNERGLTTASPIREIYHKGPGMIFKGNPKNYLTEIQVMIEE
jgi:DNA-binding transcriptional MerR regulator